MFTFKLEKEDGTSAEPATLHTVVPNRNPGYTIPRGPLRDKGPSPLNVPVIVARSSPSPSDGC
jgi:hypothetical protein